MHKPAPGGESFGKRLVVQAPAGYLDDVHDGDSIALNGACMTVTDFDVARSRFGLDISAESLDKTAGLDTPGPVNLEKALRAHDRLGGHLVAGHVDGVGRISHFAAVGEHWELRVQAPRELARFVAYKGSVTVNGVSLTVNQVADTDGGCEFSINLIPHTLQQTTLGRLTVGARVNLEIDLIARYVERMLGSAAGSGLTGGAAAAAAKPATYNRGMPISPVPELVSELAAGRMVILVDEEDRENEGDLVLAAEHVSAQAINFMARFGRGLICLTLSRERCERLQLPPMTHRNGTRLNTPFTVSIEAAEGVSTGISAADRARTVQAAVARDARPSDLVQPGHIFPLQAQDGGVLMRAGHTEAGCDLARMAGLEPAAVICEVMKDDGTMARLGDLELFAQEHGLKIGTIADLIGHRSRNESLIQRAGSRPMTTPYGEFTCHTFRDHAGGLHLALAHGQWSADDEVVVRVHEPYTALDMLDADGARHSWPLPLALKTLQESPRGLAVLLNCVTPVETLVGQLHTPELRTKNLPQALRTYGIGAQILRELGVRRMKLLGNPRPMPSMTGYNLEVTGFVAPRG